VRRVGGAGAEGHANRENRRSARTKMESPKIQGSLKLVETMKTVTNMAEGDDLDLGPSEPRELLRIKSRSDPHGRVHSVRTLWNLRDDSHGPGEWLKGSIYYG
jgi:hypothetical protein